MFDIFIQQRTSMINGVFDQNLNQLSPDQSGKGSSVSSGERLSCFSLMFFVPGTEADDSAEATRESRPHHRLRPAQTRFTLFEYGNITRSEIAATQDMIRAYSDRNKKKVQPRPFPALSFSSGLAGT